MKRAFAVDDLPFVDDDFRNYVLKFVDDNFKIFKPNTCGPGRFFMSHIQDDIIEDAKFAYQELIALGVSKEQARTILPLNLNTTMIWTGSLYALIRLCKQRLKGDAQKETRDVVQEMLRQVKETNLFTTSLTAYNL